MSQAEAFSGLEAIVQSPRTDLDGLIPVPNTPSIRRADGGYPIPVEAIKANPSSAPEVVEKEVNLAPARHVDSRPPVAALQFLVENNLGEEINVREAAAPNIVTMGRGALQATHVSQMLCLCYPGANNKWTSPFIISDVGTTYVKISKAGQIDRLVRADILREDGTILVRLSIETENWPFKMRNHSDVELVFWQSNPDMDDGGAGVQSDWRPRKYKLSARSIMVYSWDYPAAKSKELTINVFGKEPRLNMDEVIGSARPLDSMTTSSKQKTISVDFKVRQAQGPARDRDVLQLEVLGSDGALLHRAELSSGPRPQAPTPDEDTLAEVERAALGRSWLKECGTPGEEYIAHIAPSDPATVIMVTSQRILCIKTISNGILASFLNSPASLKREWQIPFQQITNLTKDPTGVHVRFRREMDGAKGMDIAIGHRVARDYFWRKLNVAVEGYNRNFAGR